jgi:GT2 family glycosyltransferase
VAVCENGTGPESVEAIRRAIETEGWSDWVMLKAIHPNRGFTGGNNAILSEAMAWPEPPRYFVLLNADTIVRPGAIRELVRGAEHRPDAGLIGPRLEWPDGDPQVSAFRDFNPVSEFLAAACTGPLSHLFRNYDVPIPVSDEPMEPQWVTLACALVRKEVFQRIGLLDEGYYLYFDDADLCRRARRDGWRILYWPSAHVVHLRGRSNPVKETTRKLERRPRYWYESRARYFAKCHSRLTLWTANLAWWLGRGVSFARELVGHKQKHTCKHESRDIWTHILNPMKANPPGQGASRS